MNIKTLTQILIFGSVVALLPACGGGGGDDADSAFPDPSEHISAEGFLDSGLLVGDLDGTEVLFLLQEPNYFLLAGEFVSTGTYEVTGIELMAEGTAYDVTGELDPTPGFVLRGEYRTDRHVDIAWIDPESGAERALNVEGAPLYFEDASIDKLLGAWINQDESNLTFFSISINQPPIAADDFIAADPGVEIEVDVLANDRDEDGDPIRVIDVDARSSRGGDVTLDDNGTPEDFSDDRVLYLAPSGLTEGTDTFGYTIQDQEEGSDDADVTVTLPVRQSDVSVALQTPNEAPMAGEVVPVSVTVSNDSDVAVQIQVGLDIGDGLVYRNDDAAGSYDADKAFWAIRLPEGETRTLNLDLFVSDFGNFDLAAEITGLDAIDQSSGDNSALIEFVPGGLASEPPPSLPQAQIEGVILSSLTQITGNISVPAHGNNAYPVTIQLGAGGLGGGSSGEDPYTGYVILSEELVETGGDDGSDDGGDGGSGDGSDSGSGGGSSDGSGDGSGDGTDGGSDTGSGGDGSDSEAPTTELRETMLVLTANGANVYLNRLFFVREDELNGDDN